MPDNNSWTEWSKYVLKELERLNEAMEKMGEEVRQLNNEMLVLKTKIAVIATLASFAGGAIGYAVTKVLFH